MKIKLVAYGIARDILKAGSMDVDLKDSETIDDLKQLLVERYPDFGKLQSLRFAVNEDYQDNAYILNPGDEVVIIPPVSGG